MRWRLLRGETLEKLIKRSGRVKVKMALEMDGVVRSEGKGACVPVVSRIRPRLLLRQSALRGNAAPPIYLITRKPQAAQNLASGFKVLPQA
jgi:hypothetical protein